MDEALEINTVYKAFIEAWHSFLLQIPGILVGILIIVIGYYFAKKLGNITANKISKKSEDPLMSRFIGNTIKVLIFLIACMWALKAAGLESITTFLFTSLGASAIVFGFAFKDIGENFISGVILAFNRPFHVNDTVKINDLFGKIKSLEFRYTKMKTFDGRDVYIPNSDVLKNPVINYTEDGFFRWDFMVGLAYEDDIDSARALIQKIMDKHPDIVHDTVHENYVSIDELASSTVNLKIFFWVETLEFRKEAILKKGDVIKRIKNALEEGGYSMPSDIHEIKLYGSQQDIPITLVNKTPLTNPTNSQLL